MKILYIYPLTTEGGSSIHATEFVAACKRIGCTIDALPIPMEAGRPAKNALSKLMRLGVANIVYFFHMLRAFVQSRPDFVVIRFQPNHTFFLGLAVIRLLSRLVLEVNGTRAIEWADHSTVSDRFLDRLSFLMANRVFVVSNVLRSRLLATYPMLAAEKVSVIPNGCNPPTCVQALDSRDLKVELGLEHYKAIVGYVGSFKPWHDVESIMKLALASPAGIGYLIVGEGATRAAYLARAREQGLKNILFVGNVPHNKVYDYLGLFDIALLPVPDAWCRGIGGFHGSPLKLFDYMAMAKPVIATASGDITEIVDDGVTGYHTEPEDVNAMLQKILFLANNKTLARNMGESGQRKLMEKYTWDANASQVVALCESINRTRQVSC